MQYNRIMLYVIFIGLLSCKSGYVEKNRFREINQVNTLEVYSKTGNVIINGWSDNYIDIYTEKILKSGLQSDIVQLQVDINYFEQTKSLVITCSAPERIDGNIHLSLHVPSSMNTINVSTQKDVCEIKDFFGNISYHSESGSLDCDFSGSIGKFYSESGTMNITMKPVSTYDMLIRNNHGSIYLSDITAFDTSYMDITSINGTIHFEKIDSNVTTLFATSMNDIMYNKIEYPLANYEFDGTYYSLIHTTEKELVSVTLDSPDGYITLD